MAKLVKTYEDGIEKFELTFRGKTYEFSMLEDDRYGRKSDKPGFFYQIIEDWPEFKHDEEFESIIDDIDTNEDDAELLFMALEALDNLEV